MLSSTEAGLVTQAMRHMRGTERLSKDALQECLAGLQAMVESHNLLALAAQRRGVERHVAQLAAGVPLGGKGRPPSVVYEVEFGPFWRVRVVGTAEAVKAVNEELVKNNMPPVSKGAISMGAGGRGWWRKITTDNGDYDLTVRKVADLAEDVATSAEPAKAAEPDLVRLSVPKKLGAVLVARGSPEHEEALAMGGKEVQLKKPKSPKS